MTLPIIFSSILYLAFTIYFFCGVFVLSLNLKSRLHRLFFYACLTISIWSFSFVMSNSAPDAAASLYWRRVAAVGWGSFYSIVLHFILALTVKSAWLKKKWVYPILYFPAAVSVFVFSIYTDIAVEHYDLIKIYAGWVNVADATVWDWLYRVYYMAFTIAGMVLIWRWGRSSKKRSEQKQAYLLIASFAVALLFGTFTEFVINFTFPFKVPQLGPVFVVIPVIVMYFCTRADGLIVIEETGQEDDRTQIMNQANRTTLFRYLGQAYLVGGFINFATQYFNAREQLESLLLFFAINLSIGIFLQLIQNLKMGLVFKDILVSVIMTVSIPLIALRYSDRASFFSLSIPIIFVMASVLFSRRWVVVLVGSSALLTLVWVWIASPSATVTVVPPDHLSRIVFFAIFLWMAAYVNHIFRQRLAEKEKQFEAQKQLSRVTAIFTVIDEKNIDLTLNEVLRLLGEYFKAERAFLFFFSINGKTRNSAYEWCTDGVESVIEIMAERTAADLPQWVDLKRMERDGGVCIADSAALPELSAEKSYLQNKQIQSMLAIPVFAGEKVMGILGFETLHYTINWAEDDRKMLKMIANRISDIWLKVDAEKRINYMAYHDALTGLPNRLLVEDRLDQAISLAARTANYVVAAFIDIDNLKRINDTMGHDCGDILLVQVASRLSGCLRQYDTLGRLGGDEFLIVAPQISQPEDIHTIAEKIIETFREPIMIKKEEHFATASIGIAAYPVDGATSAELIKHADLAMYISKEQGKNRYTLCSPDIKKDFQINMELSNSLYRAQERSELELYYQPRVAAATGEINGVEALLRWNHPEMGMVLPAQFIPIAEQNGLINPIGQWVLRTACRQNKAWQDQGYKPVVMAVNLATAQLLNNRFIENTVDLLHETGLSPAYLEFEISDSLTTRESESLVKTLNELKRLGVGITIDDFGTENASLSRLKGLPIDRIKIDLQFIHGVSIERQEEGIIRVMLQLARTLDFKVTAEGVETGQQLAFLKKIACDEAQGCYLYRPMPGGEMESILKNLPPM